MSNKLKLTFGYEDTDYTRIYAFDVADSIDATAAASMKAAVKAVNASLTAGTAGGLSSFFVSDEGDNFTLITDAQLELTEKTVLNLS